MLSINKKRKLRFAGVTVAVLLVGLSIKTVLGAYIPTSRDTKLPPDTAVYEITAFDAYEKIYETDKMVYYYKEDTDVIAIEEKLTGYVWKTGLDIPYGSDLETESIMKKTIEEKLEVAEYIEDSMNDTYTGIANSLITVEYRDPSAPDSVKNISSASKAGATSKLMTLNGNPATMRLDVSMHIIDLQFPVYINFGETSITYEINYDEITGSGKSMMTSINITPFLGASGGKNLLLNEETGLYNILEPKYMVPGYIFVPDGSGALIRYADNTKAFTEYIGDVYGIDPSQEQFYYNYLSNYVPIKDPLMPVFGMAHGNNQSAFVAYVDEGDEYMQIVARPEENRSTNYNWAYPRFVYNQMYHQVYNKKGEGFFTLMEEPNHVNISITYEFLHGDSSDGTPAADYIGMAQAYRKHLIEKGMLTEQTVSEGDIPIRVDFIMSDVKRGLASPKDVVVTTTDQVDSILNDIINNGVQNISSGLYGWQKGGVTLARPYQAKYSSDIGKKNDFMNLFSDFREKGIDISVVQDFVTINKDMLNYYNNASKHVNSWYLFLSKVYILPDNVPVTSYSYATPEKSTSWLKEQIERFKNNADSLTIEGISDTLTSNYKDNSVTSVSDAISLYEGVLESEGDGLKYNMTAPNQYMWKYTDRFLQAPVGHSQYVFETDAVPFLQMVLHGTMEVYAPYANFSFYTQSDVLKMIDYNLYPSFILSGESSHNLASTASSHLYSTEYSLYEKLIVEIYDKINSVLKKVQGYSWSNRTVLDSGVICNTYTKNGETKQIVINYTDEAYYYEGITIEALTAYVLE